MADWDSEKKIRRKINKGKTNRKRDECTRSEDDAEMGKCNFNMSK